MNNREALEKSYKILAPFSDKQKWEFNNNLVHLNFLTKHLDKSQTIFDAGCGIGILAMALKLLGYNIEGGDKFLFEQSTEFSVQDLNKLQAIWREQGVAVKKYDVISDELEKEYDVVISIATIEHQKNPRGFLEKLKNAVKPDGYLYIATPNIAHLLNRVRFLCGRSPMSGHAQQYFEKGENFTGHWKEYDLNELKQVFSWSGLQIVSAKNIQSMKPKLSLKNLRAVYVNLFILISYLLPGAKDTNIILGRKK